MLGGYPKLSKLPLEAMALLGPQQRSKIQECGRKAKKALFCLCMGQMQAIN